MGESTGLSLCELSRPWAWGLKTHQLNICSKRQSLLVVGGPSHSSHPPSWGRGGSCPHRPQPGRAGGLWLCPLTEWEMASQDPRPVWTTMRLCGSQKGQTLSDPPKLPALLWHRCRSSCSSCFLSPVLLLPPLALILGGTDSRRSRSTFFFFYIATSIYTFLLCPFYSPSFPM